VSRELFDVVFDGDALAEHKMDVQDLAPSLLGLGDTIRKANTKLNGDKATVNVYVTSGLSTGASKSNSVPIHSRAV